MNLTAITQAVKAVNESREARTCTVVLSVLAPGLPDLVFREPNTADIFAATQDVLTVRKRKPSFPDTLAQQVALLSRSHQLPAPGEGEKALDMYVAIAENKELFLHILKAHQEAFPDVHDFEAAREQAAKN